MQFLEEEDRAYAERRNQPAEDVTSGLSPYLHAGHISAHQVFWETMAHDGWSAVADQSARRPAAREGWWGASPHVESFLDELITWREVGFNMCHCARTTTNTIRCRHGRARRSRNTRTTRVRTCIRWTQFEAAQTHDPSWNAAQRQLVREGRIHNYLRMLWGKKILEWTSRPADALAILIELNNKYALDGRDPNSYSGIFWCLGRYDRAVGSRTPGVRQDPLHEQREHGAQSARAGVPRAYGDDSGVSSVRACPMSLARSFSR